MPKLSLTRAFGNFSQLLRQAKLSLSFLEISKLFHILIFLFSFLVN